MNDNRLNTASALSRRRGANIHGLESVLTIRNVGGRITRFFGAAAAAAGLLFGTAAFADPLTWKEWQPTDRLKAIEQAREAIAAGKDPIPGPRSCFWNRGPGSVDPYLNVSYPSDADTFYWAAVFTVPQGAQLRLEGKFPHSRYISFISYDQDGRSLESVADYLIAPEPGSTNPFLPGADRNATARSYKLDVVDGPVDLQRKTGFYEEGAQQSSIHAPKYGAGQQVIFYRNYLRDHGTDETGGVGLPEPVLKLADGTELRGAAACPALKSRQPLQITPEAIGVPMEKYNELKAAAAKISPTFPATNPPIWHQQLDREAFYGIYTGQPPREGARKSEGGFYANLDNQHLRAIINRKLGNVVVLRGKIPATPHTAGGDAKMGSGDLRFWSLCSTQGIANSRVTACLVDEQVPVGPDGFYTIVVSRAEDRPRNAFPQCGVAWLPMADDGDGSGDADVTYLQIRNMLSAKTFTHSIQAVGRPGDEAKDMGDYFPRAKYTTTSSFEAFAPCSIEKR